MSRFGARIAARDGGWKCHYCGREFVDWADVGPHAHADHVLPQAQGGTDTLDNLVLACGDCNIKKGGRTPEQWEGVA